jgi:hypothetical protein
MHAMATTSDPPATTKAKDVYMEELREMTTITQPVNSGASLSC